MSREIKFRGWDKDTELMIKWNELLALCDGKRIAGVPREFMQAFNRTPPDNQVVMVSMQGNPFTKDEVVLMQYTGLRDSNGVEIYEGDIVALEMWHGNDHGYIPEHGVIKWYQPSSAFKWFSLEEDQSDSNNYWLSESDERQREVVGNIYANPEILEAYA